MVPQVNNAEEAQQVVTYSKFPPLGLRGQGSAFPSIGHGITPPEYMKTANETLLTMIQIETAEGVKNVDAIAAVPGVGKHLPGAHSRSSSIFINALHEQCDRHRRSYLYRS